MSNLVEVLFSDVRVKEGLNACIHCGTCTAICPAASFYDYDPRELTALVQMRDENVLADLLRTNYIWLCGECMSCKTRCPKDNVPGILIEALRDLSQKTGAFVESEKGRQQLMLKRSIGDWILEYGYCVVGSKLLLNMFPEQGPNWQWVLDNIELVYKKQGSNYLKEGSGAMRKVPQKDLDEINRIFEVTGGLERYNEIERFSEAKAKEMGLGFDNTHDCEYFKYIYSHNSEEK